MGELSVESTSMSYVDISLQKGISKTEVTI